VLALALGYLDFSDHHKVRHRRADAASPAPAMASDAFSA
jgi:hypothetical protein